MDMPEDQHHEKSSDDQAASESPIAASASAGDGKAANSLPAVQSPRLGSEDIDEEAVGDPLHAQSNSRTIGAVPALFREPINSAAGGAAAPGPQSRQFRFALLAAAIACAAGLGALVGSLTASGIDHQDATVAAVAIPQAGDPHDIVGALKAQRAELSALKASLDSTTRSTSAQLAKLNDRLNNLEHAAADPSGKLAHVADAVDRLEKQVGAPEDITGSIAAPAPAAAAGLPKLTGPVLHDWAVQNVRNGRAMVESRYGAFFLVGAGSIMPGLGHVRQVKRQDGEWIVVTDKGLITQHP